MFKKLIALCVTSALVVGSAAKAAAPGGPGGGVDCTTACAESIFLPNGTFCVLDGCLTLDDGTIVYCNYSCFWGLPPL